MSFLPGRKGLEELGTDRSKLMWAWILQGLLPKTRASPGVMVSVLWVSPSLDWSGFGAGGRWSLSLPAHCSGGSAGLEHYAGKIP